MLLRHSMQEQGIASSACRQASCYHATSVPWLVATGFRLSRFAHVDGLQQLIKYQPYYQPHLTVDMKYCRHSGVRMWLRQYSSSKGTQLLLSKEHGADTVLGKYNVV